MLLMQMPGLPVAPSLVTHWLSAVHAPQVFDVQIGLVATVQSAEALHSTHAPDVPQRGLEAARAPHAPEAAEPQPAQALATQKLFVRSFVH